MPTKRMNRLLTQVRKNLRAESRLNEAEDDVPATARLLKDMEVVVSKKGPQRKAKVFRDRKGAQKAVDQLGKDWEIRRGGGGFVVGRLIKEVKTESRLNESGGDLLEVDFQVVALAALMDYVVPERDMIKLYRRLEKEDETTAKLFYEVFSKLQDEMSLSSGAEEALGRVRNAVTKGQNWDVGMLRNNIFKAANSLGIKLPHGMF